MISHQEFRKRQIDTLKIFNDKVNEVIENEEYSIQFESGDNLLKLIVKLSLEFPYEKPLILIQPIIQHPWCNNYTGIIDKAPGLLNYNQHSDLGRVVQAIIREFEKYPPSLITTDNNIRISMAAAAASTTTTPTTTITTIINNDTATTLNNNITSGGQGATAASTNYYHVLNDINYAIPELTKLSLNELKKLDTDPQFFDDFIEELSIVQALNNELDSMINQVDIISRENQSKESHLKEIKLKLFHDVDTLKSLGEHCDKLNQKYMKKSEEYAPQHIRELLQIAASNADSDCEKHVEQFLSSKMDVQTFLNYYGDSKKISAMRKSKEERLAHQLNALEKAGH